MKAVSFDEMVQIVKAQQIEFAILVFRLHAHGALRAGEPAADLRQWATYFPDSNTASHLQTSADLCDWMTDPDKSPDPPTWLRGVVKGGKDNG